MKHILIIIFAKSVLYSLQAPDITKKEETDIHMGDDNYAFSDLSVISKDGEKATKL